MSDAERVVVTGLGMTSPLGADVSSTWAALLAGCSGVRALTGPDYAGLPVRIAAPVAQEPGTRLSRLELHRWDRGQQLAVLAARQAWADAGFNGTAEAAGLDPERVGVVVGTGIGGITTTVARYRAFLDRGWSALSPYTVTMTMPNASAAAISQDIAARAGAHAPVSACATGAEAIGQALGMIRGGRADVVVAGGTEAAIHPFTIAGFAAMRALSRRNDDPPAASRPFDHDRDGFVLGEGAGMLVLESAAHAAARGATGHAEIAGAGFSSDSYHVARSDPDGTGPQLAMRRALADAGASPAEVAHVNAHATSTPIGDLTEARAIEAVLGDSGREAPAIVTATKSLTGHLLGAAGAVEAIATILVLRDRLVPPTVNLDHPDPAIRLDIASGAPRALAPRALAPRALAGRVPATGASAGRVPAPGASAGRADGQRHPAQPLLALNNSFGFGGHNVVLAFREIV